MRLSVVIARFQVPELTAGHRHLLDFASSSERTDLLIVLLGTALLDGRDERSPLTYFQRSALVQEYFGLPGGRNLGTTPYTVLPLPDRVSNHEWSKSVDDLIALFHGETDSVRLYGGRDSFIDAYKGKYRTVRVPEHSDDSGTELRRNLDVTDYLHDRGFRAGQTWTLQRQWPQAFPYVDIAVVEPAGALGGSDVRAPARVLLIQRADTEEWCLPGGFVNPSEISFEMAVRRELYEKMGLVTEAVPKYVTSAGGPAFGDWRYAKSRHGIISALFWVPKPWGIPKVNTAKIAKYTYATREEAAHHLLFSHAPHHLPFVEKIFEVFEE